MTKGFIAKLHSNRLEILPGHKQAFKQYAKDNAGIFVKITPHTVQKMKLRRFFEGAVVPYFALQTYVKGQGGTYRHFTTKEAREALKLEFNGVFMRQVDGELREIPGSTKGMNATEFEAFVNRCIEHMIDNGLLYPDSNRYRQWEESAPPPDELYPGVVEVIEKSKEELRQLNYEAA